jgi:hypothetical protein
VSRKWRPVDEVIVQIEELLDLDPDPFDEAELLADLVDQFGAETVRQALRMLEQQTYRPEPEPKPERPRARPQAPHPLWDRDLDA